MASLRKLIINETAFYLFSKLIPGISGLLFVIIVTNIVGINEYGKYSLIFYKCTLIASFSFSWINQSEIRYGNRLNNFSFKIRPPTKTIILLCFCIVILFSLLMNLENKKLSIACILIIGFSSYLKTIFQSNFLPKAILYFNVFQSIVFIALPFFLKNKLDLNSNHILAIYMISLLCSSSLIVYFKIEVIKDYFRRVSFDNSKIYSWLKFGLPLSVWGSLSISLSYLDRFFINKFFNDFELGVYSTLNEISSRLFSFLIFPLLMAAHPRIVKLWNDGFKLKSFNIINHLIVYISIVIFIIFLIFIFFGDYIFSILISFIPQINFGFRNLITPLILSGAMWQLALFTHKIIELREKTYHMIFFILLSIFINIYGNAYFLPKYGMIATAYTSLLSSFSYCFLTYIYFIYFKRKLSE